MADSIRNRLVEQAGFFVNSELPYQFNPIEKNLISRFFTNTTGRIFFIHSLPENMIASLLAMYSRMTNHRGLRGLFVDSFLPQALAALTDECQNQFDGNPAKFVQDYKIKTLDDFINHSNECFQTFKDFMALGVDPDYLAALTASSKMADFLKKWLDQYGHNSIARTAELHICFEQISILAAKSLEWCRPGSAYIELSTRYVDMSGTAVYPIEEELALWGVDRQIIYDNTQKLYDYYKRWQGENFTGPLPSFLRQTHTPNLPEATKAQITMGVIGETCDVLGNFLPASTLTSVGVSISGEALPMMIKHLRLDDTPENHAIVDVVTMEAKKIGADQFLRHTNITDFDKMNWSYLSPRSVSTWEMPNKFEMEIILRETLGRLEFFVDDFNLDMMLQRISKLERLNYDKLAREFESVAVSFKSIMSFRGWRDLQRMGFCAHKRSRFNPILGFYHYDKPAPSGLNETFKSAWAINQDVYVELTKHNVPKPMREYHMALGNNVTFWLAGNLRQIEFCNWQRTKPSVNHEVRQKFLFFETLLRQNYPWWEKLSRADTTPAYIFARGSAVPIEL